MKNIHAFAGVLLCILCLSSGCRDKQPQQLSEAARIKMLGDSLFLPDFMPADTLTIRRDKNLRFSKLRRIAFGIKEESWKSRIVDKLQLMRYVAMTNYKIEPLEILGKKMYRCENDILRSEENVHRFVYHRLKMAWEDSLQGQPKEQNFNKLVVVEDEETHKIVRWDESKQIRYCLDNSFSAQEKKQVIKAMKAAREDWKANTSEICPRFKEILYLNDTSHATISKKYRSEVDFVVTKGPSKEQGFYASAFFPDEDLFENRLLVIGASFFEKSDSFQIGACRHEMGHILGLLHEHIYNSARNCSREITPGKPRHYICNEKEVDIFSVMHYLCGEKGTDVMTISSCDAEGINYFYSLEQPGEPSPKHDKDDEKPSPKPVNPPIPSDPALRHKR